MECSSLKYTDLITAKFCTRHDNYTVMACIKFRCDRWVYSKPDHCIFWSNSIGHWYPDSAFSFGPYFFTCNNLWYLQLIHVDHITLINITGLLCGALTKGQWCGVSIIQDISELNWFFLIHLFLWLHEPLSRIILFSTCISDVHWLDSWLNHLPNLICNRWDMIRWRLTVEFYYQGPNISIFAGYWVYSQCVRF